MEETKRDEEIYGAWVEWRYFRAALFISAYSAACKKNITDVDITDVDDFGNVFSVYD